MAESDAFDPEMSNTVEEAYAKYRARVITFPNGTTITEGELEDMDPQARTLFIRNMFATNKPEGEP